MTIPQIGEVWLADLGLAAKIRPVILVSAYDIDGPRALIVYVPLTTQIKGGPYEVVLPKVSFLNRDSVANVLGVASLPLGRLQRRLGKISADVLDDVKQALMLLVDLS